MTTPEVQCKSQAGMYTMREDIIIALRSAFNRWRYRRRGLTKLRPSANTNAVSRFLF